MIIGLYVLANFAERSPRLRIVSFIFSAAIVAGGAVLYALIVLAAIAAGVPADQLGLSRNGAVGLIVAAMIGLLYLFPVFQDLLARIIPVRRGSPVDYLSVLLAILLVAQQVGGVLPQAAKPLTYGDLLAQDIPFFILAFAGVGIFVRRSPTETIDRLGLRPPRLRRWWAIAVVGIGVFLVIAYSIDRLAEVVAPAQQKQVTDITNVLFSHFNSPAAAVFLGVLAGVVEETIFRGALVPRMGVIVSAILFAALHTQYAISFATLEVLVLGIGLGMLRVWSRSTLPCIVTHAGYDIAVGLIPFIFK